MEKTKGQIMKEYARFEGINFESNYQSFGYQDAFNEFSEKTVMFNQECFEAFEAELSVNTIQSPEYKRFIERKKQNA